MGQKWQKNRSISERFAQERTSQLLWIAIGFSGLPHAAEVFGSNSSNSSYFSESDRWPAWEDSVEVRQGRLSGVGAVSGERLHGLGTSTAFILADLCSAKFRCR